MAKNIEDACVGCPTSIGCMGGACPNHNLVYYDCDECGEEFDTDELYDYEGEMLCSKCLLDKFTTIADKE